MIRPINKFDLPDLRKMMRMFRSESPLSFLHDIDNEAYFDEIVLRIVAGAGIGFIDEQKGFILGMIAPSLWCDKTLVLYELAWYVKPEYRNGLLGPKLLKRYLSEAKAIKSSGRIKAFTMAKMATSPNIKYDKLGFSKLEEIWIQ